MEAGSHRNNQETLLAVRKNLPTPSRTSPQKSAAEKTEASLKRKQQRDARAATNAAEAAAEKKDSFPSLKEMQT